jgi:hypothetical protein
MDLETDKFKKPLFRDKKEIGSDKTFQTLHCVVGWGTLATKGQLVEQ